MKLASWIFRSLGFVILILAFFQAFGEEPKNDDVAKNLEEKRQTIEDKQREIEEREARLKQQEVDLEKKIKKMEELRSEISSEVDKQHKGNEERVGKMVVVFETMTPKSAAGVLETLDDWLAVEILKRMDSKRMAKVMNIMDKSRSARLSEMLTGFVKTVPTGRTVGGETVQISSQAPPAVPPQAAVSKDVNSKEKGGKP